MKILVLNAGSSSLKYQLFELPKKEVLVVGLIEKIGEKESHLKHKIVESNAFEERFSSIENHKEALDQVSELLLMGINAVIKNSDEIVAVGHRVVHGGERFSEPTLIDTEEKIQLLKDISYLAPLHNPANILGIEIAMATFPSAKQVAVFDTAFHNTLPDFVYRYAIPERFYIEQGVRAYGFHGTSHQYVSLTAAQFLNIPVEHFNCISIHLGNGCSITAIQNGKSIDTSMGMTPIGGLVMGTRPGDFDPSLIFFLADHLQMSLPEVDRMLNKESGLKGLAGDNDVRSILEKVQNGDPRAKLAMAIYCYRIRKYIGAYAAALNRVDSIVFTAGVGENSAYVRQHVCDQLNILGVQLDHERNNAEEKGIREIHRKGSELKILVVPTNEELQIVRETEKLL